MKHFDEDRLDVLHALMRSHPLATLVTPTSTELLVDHLPLRLDAGDGPFGTLRGHVSRGNPLWRSLPGHVPSVAVFQGPQAYVSPSWYPSKHADGKAVPTWNYAVVHAHGVPRAIEDPQWLLQQLTLLTDQHESFQALPWKVSDAPRDFIDRLLGAIVGIEMPVTQLRGRWKVSQNRPLADRLGVAAGLQSRDGDEAQAMAALVMQRAVP
ncbi:MAG TPA: FMN-binding negative transcriptional regulator [Albitalea sp.]|nr:FMN-binding negative transcriptional regulator [Albitalea sp.]